MKRSTICVFLFVLSLLASAAQAPQPTALPVGSATIEDVKGQVSVRSAAGVAMAPQRGQVLSAESTIETEKGSALLHLEDGSQVLVKAHSRVVLKAPATSNGNFFEMMIGKIVAKIQKRLGNSPSFRMGTPTAVITVRGTRFEVNVDKKGKTLVDVYEGIVEVASLGAPNQPVILHPGFWTQVPPHERPETPRSRADLEREMDRRSGAWPGQEGEGVGSPSSGETQNQGTESSQPQQQQPPEQESEPH